MRQLHSQSRREDRRDSDTLMSRSDSQSRSRLTSRVSINNDRIRCYMCREYDHFASECPNSVTDRDSEQDDLNNSTLHMLTQDSLVGLEVHESIECLKVRMVPLHFCLWIARKVDLLDVSKAGMPYV